LHCSLKAFSIDDLLLNTTLLDHEATNLPPISIDDSFEKQDQVLAIHFRELCGETVVQDPEARPSGGELTMLTWDQEKISRMKIAVNEIVIEDLRERVSE
jgi:hypothetical protein